MIPWLLISFFVLLFLGVPIAMSLGLAAIGGILFLDGGNVVTIAQRMFEGMNSFALLAIPLYTFAGFTMSKGGISDRLMNFCYSIVGHIYGGLAHVNVLSSMIFAGISGSAVADTAGVSGMFMPTMIKQGYSKKFTVAVTAISSTIGIIIPPSIPMVVIAGICGLSTGKLFLGGIIPGILVGAALLLVSWVFAKKRNYPAEAAMSRKEFFHAIFKGIPALMTVLIILGGITTGFFTPTEAAGVAALYTFLLGRFMYRELSIKDIPGIMLEVAITTGQVVLMIATASALGWVFAQQNVPAIISSAVLGLTTNKYVLLLLINLLLLFVGTWMDLSPAVMIFCPILLPIVTALGMDPVHFGVIMVINLAIGLFTPPVGVCLFLACGIAKVSITDTIKAFLPYFLSMVVVLLLITYCEPLVMFLPNLLMG